MIRLRLVLGTLGSGKTTYIKNFLAREHGKIAVLVNDFGAEDVDGALVEDGKTALRVEKIYDGSVFCACKSDKFTDAMLALSETDWDWTVVETSGMANPFGMKKLLDFINERAVHRYEYAGAVCILDAATCEKSIGILHAAKMQIAVADSVLVNKSDLVDDKTRGRIEKTVRAINADAPIAFTTNAYAVERYRIKDRALPPFIEDITVQKVKVELRSRTDGFELETICRRLAAFCNRIKGIVSMADGQNVFEYIDGTLKTYQTEREGNFIIAVAVGGFSLKSKVKAVLDGMEKEYALW